MGGPAGTASPIPHGSAINPGVPRPPSCTAEGHLRLAEPLRGRVTAWIVAIENIPPASSPAPPDKRVLLTD